MGKTLQLQPDEVLVESSSPEGYAVAEGGGVLVALDTTMTPELRQEGIARELVRNIQDARKSAGFAIADRIAVHLGGVAGDAELETTVRQWGDYIRAETLADDLILDAAGRGRSHRGARPGRAGADGGRGAAVMIGDKRTR